MAQQAASGGRGGAELAEKETEEEQSGMHPGTFLQL
jgi:hypothetical protein